MHFLLIKTHTKTGLKYLCRHSGTRETCRTYKGSGKYWRRHLKTHGNDHTTEIIFETDSMAEFAEKGLHYSTLYDIVASKEWANFCPEVGTGVGAGNLHPLFGKPRTAEHRANQSKGQTGLKKSEATKRKISEARKRYLAAHPEVVTAQAKNLGERLGGADNIANLGRHSKPGWNHTEKTITKIRVASKGENNSFFGQQHTAETKAKQSAAKKGMFDGAKNPSAKHWRFTSPTGEVFEVVGQTRQFCTDHKLTWVTFEYALKNNSWPITRGVNAGWKVERLCVTLAG